LRIYQIYPVVDKEMTYSFYDFLVVFFYFYQLTKSVKEQELSERKD